MVGGEFANSMLLHSDRSVERAAILANASTLSVILAEGGNLLFRILRDRQQISIRVSEPFDARTARRLPDAACVLVHQRIALGRDTTPHELSDGVNYARDLPTERGEGLRSEQLDFLES
jgi:hypothetical protein